jgi:S-DNA-T family DNA segregation ATPase FtsK/SpoIIIE
VKNPHDAVVLGVGGDDAQPIHVPATGAMTLLVAGPPRSGRSTLLCTVLSQLAGRADQSIVVAAPIRSPLAVQARNAGLPVHGPDDHMPDRTDSIAARSTVVLLDDLDRYEGGRFAEELLEHLRDRPDDVAVIATSRTEDVATSYRGLTAMLRRNRCGVLLCPGPVDGDVLGVHLPRHREPMPPGRGVLVGDPGWGGACASAPMLPIQVAQP